VCLVEGNSNGARRMQKLKLVYHRIQPPLCTLKRLQIKLGKSDL
jgi:hypothetical protein